MTLIPDFFRRLFERKEKIITFYNTYGYKEEADAWTIPLRIWVHKRRSLSLEVVARRVRHKMEADLERPLKDEEATRLKACLADFVADDDSREPLELVFDEDSNGAPYRLSRRTNLNGLIEEEIKLPVNKARELLARQGSKSGWLTLTALSESFQAKGRVRLIEPEGVSVVSDIDDTIKVTEVPAGKKIVLARTFLQGYEEAPGMRDRYLQIRDEHADASFHYVSGSPWQLYSLLQQFLITETGFPEGTFHMKSLRKNLFDRDSWHDIRNFVIAGESVTLEQKIEQITALMLNLPRRKFILIGDSGEKDPEVYRAMVGLFPGQVKEIRIRDVLGERLTEKAGDISISLVPAKTVFFETRRIAEEKKRAALQAKEARR
jgi:hypothetical protein